MLTTSEKITALMQWGTKPYRIYKSTGVNENTVRDIWNGKTEIGKIKLDTAEKLAWYYDTVERNLSEAIALVDMLIFKLDNDRQRLQGNYNLYQKLKREPFKVFEHLHKVALEPQYSHKLNDVMYYIDEISKRMETIDMDIAYNVTLSDMYTYYMSVQRNKFAKQSE